MVYITRREHFSASHRLYNPDWSDDKNWEVYGKCNNPNGHGHNYEIEVTVAGNPPRETGMVIDLKKLSDIINNEIIDVVDHKHLNCDVEFMNGIIPTAENMAIEFWKILETKITGGRLYSITLYESPNNFVEYRGE
ncbi:MAG: 6-carboxytetrahydropterin synthase [Bacteroidetes bacterium]|nr:6-carboxytetrahydropterin synthase [Bacteroidota bacterium]MCW5896260.1 6-carboxytetrahydropterin synthase [Bacteroidota bacterium]